MLRQPVFEADFGQAAQVGQGDVAPVGAKGGEVVAGQVRALVAEGDTALTSAGQKPALWAPMAVKRATAALAANVVSSDGIVDFLVGVRSSCRYFQGSRVLGIAVRFLPGLEQDLCLALVLTLDDG